MTDYNVRNKMSLAKRGELLQHLNLFRQELDRFINAIPRAIGEVPCDHITYQAILLADSLDHLRKIVVGLCIQEVATVRSANLLMLELDPKSCSIVKTLASRFQNAEDAEKFFKFEDDLAFKLNLDFGPKFTPLEDESNNSDDSSYGILATSKVNSLE